MHHGRLVLAVQGHLHRLNHAVADCQLDVSVVVVALNTPDLGIFVGVYDPKTVLGKRVSDARAFSFFLMGVTRLGMKCRYLECCHVPPMHVTHWHSPSSLKRAE